MPEDKIGVYFILSSERTEKGEFIPLIAVRGEESYHRTNWCWDGDYDKAVRLCKKKNAAMGVTPEEAEVIVADVLKYDSDFNNVDLQAAAYEWICSRCGTYQKVIEWTEQVECEHCGREFLANLPEHAIA